MLTLKELALQPDFQVGAVEVSPSRRLVSGPAGQRHVEPLTMRALLRLLDARGSVVTRDDLFDHIWGAADVGDDSLNRAMLKLRRVLEDVAPGGFGIETIPRTGYRLTGNGVETALSDAPASPPAENRMSRRTLVGGAVAATTLAGGGVWLATRDPTSPQFDLLMAKGDEALRAGVYRDKSTVPLFERAVAIEPGSARAWGLLAYFRSVRIADGSDGAVDMVRATESAIRRALELDPRETNALTAMFVLKGPMLDWAARERQLREILAIDRNSIPALGELATHLIATGYARESAAVNDRILDLAPMMRLRLVFRAQTLWILDDVAGSDRIIDRLRALWPADPFVFAIRLMLLALTDRPQAAAAMLDGTPEMLDRQTVDFWRTGLAALDARSAATIDAAVQRSRAIAISTPISSNLAVMLMGALDRLDVAFEIAESYLLWRGNSVSSRLAESRTTNSFNRRNAPWLFTPPLAAMRADPRFFRLAEQRGLAGYWSQRGVKPDYLLA